MGRGSSDVAVPLPGARHTLFSAAPNAQMSKRPAAPSSKEPAAQPEAEPPTVKLTRTRTKIKAGTLSVEPDLPTCLLLPLGFADLNSAFQCGEATLRWADEQGRKYKARAKHNSIAFDVTRGAGGVILTFNLEDLGGDLVLQPFLRYVRFTSDGITSESTGGNSSGVQSSKEYLESSASVLENFDKVNALWLASEAERTQLECGFYMSSVRCAARCSRHACSLVSARSGCHG